MIGRIDDWFTYSKVGYFVAVVLICVGAVSVVGGMAIAGAYKVGQWECQDKTAAMDRDYKYGWFKGCMVEDDNGEFVPLENWRHEE